MVQRIFWLPGETSATLGPNLRALLKLYSESVASSSPSGKYLQGCSMSSEFITGYIGYIDACKC